jgi:hypothetical protein
MAMIKATIEIISAMVTMLSCLLSFYVFPFFGVPGTLQPKSSFAD